MSSSVTIRKRTTSARAAFAMVAIAWPIIAWQGTTTARAEDWPRWRGPRGDGTALDSGVPRAWSATENIRWKTPIAGEGSSSPIVWRQHVVVASADEQGRRRWVHCLARDSGAVIWSREQIDLRPESTSALTGHAAPTPVTDGERIVAWFGNAGVMCFDFHGNLLWCTRLGEFETELGIASSPVMHGGLVFLLCDHDGNRFNNFDSFLVALDVVTGAVRWKSERPRMYRSWSTPLLVDDRAGSPQLIVCGQEEMRAHDPRTGDLIWSARGLSEWVAPTPVFADGMLFATSGRNGPLIAVRAGGRGDVTASHVAWRFAAGGSYVCSPLVVGGRLFLLAETGVLACRDVRSGHEIYRERLPGRFTASPVAVLGRSPESETLLYLVSESGDTSVIRGGDSFELVARNSIDEPCLASPAISDGGLFLRTRSAVIAVGRR